MSFQTQLGRINRWLSRIEMQPPRDPEEYDDFMWAFFQNCWHLKDWIKNDPSLPIQLRDQIESEVKACPSLLICADLANGSKHFSLDRPRAGSGATHSHRVLKVMGGDPSQTTISYFVALDDGSRPNAIAVAKNAIAEWHSLLAKYGVSA